MAAIRPSLALSRRTELVDVGDHVCLFRPDNHAVALLNASAASICADVLLAGGATPPSSLSPADLDALREHLHRAGFLDEPVAAPGPAATAAARMHGPAPPRTAPLLAVCRLAGGPRVGLSCADPGLAALLQAVLHPLACDTCRHTADISITVTGAAGDHAVSRDGTLIAQHLGLSDARRIAVQALLMALLPPALVATILHASAIEIAGQAILLAGHTGSGKSTLAAGLVGSGAGFIADDLTPLDGSGAVIHAFPLAVSAKRGSWPVLADAFPELSTRPVHRIADREVRYLDLSPRLAAQSGHGHPVRAIVFPRYAATSPIELEPVTPEEAMSIMLQTGSEIVGAPRTVRPLAGLVNRTPAWRLTFADLPSAAAAIARLIDRPASGPT